MNDDTEQKRDVKTDDRSIPEAGPLPEPVFDEPSREPPAVTDAPGRNDAF